MSDVGSKIGKGVASPLRREGGDFAMAEGADLVSGNVTQILGVRAMAEDGSYSGEYPWRQEFGSRVELLRHKNIRKTSVESDVARIFVMDAIEAWEPRAAVSMDDVEFVFAAGKMRSINVKVPVSTDTSGEVVETSTASVAIEESR